MSNSMSTKETKGLCRYIGIMRDFGDPALHEGRDALAYFPPQSVSKKSQK